MIIEVARYLFIVYTAVFCVWFCWFVKQTIKEHREYCLWRAGYLCGEYIKGVMRLFGDVSETVAALGRFAEAMEKAGREMKPVKPCPGEQDRFIFIDESGIITKDAWGRLRKLLPCSK